MAMTNFVNSILDRLVTSYGEIGTLTVNGSSRTLTVFKTPPPVIVAYDSLPCVYTAPGPTTIESDNAGVVYFEHTFTVSVIVSEMTTTTNAGASGSQAYLDTITAWKTFVEWHLNHPRLHTGSDPATELSFLDGNQFPTQVDITVFRPATSNEQASDSRYAGLVMTIPMVCFYPVETGLLT